MAIRYLAESGLKALIKAIKAAIAEAGKTAVASKVTFEDGETFQGKLDAGKLTGPAGPAGKNGEPGATGAKGDAGPAPKITVKLAETVATPGTPSVTATQDGANVTLTFDKLKGEKGDAGTPGAAGAAGAKGDTPTVTVAKGAHIGEVGIPTVTASQSGGNVTLTFDYLKGAQGATGPAGAAGKQGNTGPTGPAGPNSVSGTTSTALNGILKGTGSVVAVATAGTDYVPPARKVNGKALTGDITLAATDVGALPVKANQENQKVDFNTLTASGIYRIQETSATGTNAPTSGSYHYHVLVLYHGNGWIRQIAFDVRSNRAYARAQTNSGGSGASWTSWAEVVTAQSGKAAAATTADQLIGFSSGSTSGDTWGVQTGSTIMTMGNNGGGSIAFRKNCPENGKMSIKVGGEFYASEGAKRCYHEGDTVPNATTKNRLTFSGGSTASFDGSGAVTVPIPKVQQVSVTIPASGWKTDDADPVYLYKCEVTNNAVTAATIPTLSFAATAITKTEGLSPVVESAAGKIILRSRKALSDLTGTLILLS